MPEQPKNHPFIQRYILIAPGFPPCLTEWVLDTDYAPGTVLIDTFTGKWSKDGETWQELEEDHL